MKEEQLRRQNRLVIALVILLVAIGLGIHQFFNYSLRPVAKNDQQTITVVIPSGATDSEVAQIMKKHHLVRSRYVFDYYLQTHKTEGVKAGKFKLRRSLSVQELVAKLQQNQAAKKQ